MLSVGANTTSVITTNGTQNSSGLNVNSSRVNSNTSDSVFVETPFNNNRFNPLNVTEDSIVISNESERDRTNELANNTFSDDEGASQVSPNTNDSLQTDSVKTHDAIRNKAIKLAAEMAKGALDKAEQALDDNENIGTGDIGQDSSTIVTGNRNLQEAADATKHSGQSVIYGDEVQGRSDLIGTYDEIKVQTTDRLAQQAEMVINRAQKNLDNISGSTEVPENLNHNPDRPDASKILNNLSPQTANSKTETDNFDTENHPHTYTTHENNAQSQTGKSDVHSPRSAIVSKDLHSVGKTDLKADAGDNQKVIEGAKVTLDGTGSKIADHSGLSYSWKQVDGPKVRISDANTAIASFKAPKVPSEQDKITLKFVLLIAEDSESNGASNKNKNNNNDKDSVTITVEQEPTLGNRVSHEPSNSNNQ